MKILFSPLGDTDPVRGCYDGGCLHILRHYRPEMVVLFYTAAMKEKEDRDHRYTRGVVAVSPDCAVREIVSDAQNVHLYDELMPLLPKHIRALHEEFPEATILLNLSSATPQIKTVLAILAAEEAWCLGVQMASPARASNRHNPAAADEEDVAALLENNFDNEPGAENRCSEPPLKVIRYYEEKSRLLSLIDRYDYSGALTLAKKSDLISQDVKRLLCHADHRLRLETDKAREGLRAHGGYTLFPFHENRKKEALVEYFLTMQLAVKRDDLPSLLLKAIPFLYTFLTEYLRTESKLPLASLGERRRQTFYLERDRIENAAPDLLQFLDDNNFGRVTNPPLSYRLGDQICQYLGTHGLVKDGVRHAEILKILDKVRGCNELRNQTAHEIVNIDKEKFRAAVGLLPHEFIKACKTLLCLYHGEGVGKLQNMYDDINGWIRESLRQAEA